MPEECFNFFAVGATLLAWLTASAAYAAGPFDDAVAVWHMSDVRDNSGAESRLTVHGAVQLGVALDEPARRASLARGGDGRVAVFEGGYLSAGQGAEGELNIKGRGLSIALRLRDPKGAWSYPIFSKYGGHERLVYNVFATPLDGRRCLGSEIGSTGNRGLMQVSAPVDDFDPRAWHDVAVRCNGVKVELFVDGRCVDEDFMVGQLRAGNRLPVLIGAQAIDENRVDGRFRGQIDHVALWNRALADEEIVALAGGPSDLTRRQRTDRGIPRETMQYWRPPNSYFVGDCMPFYHDGVFHFAYLLDRKHHASKNGLGAHQWIQATSRDLVHWRHEPMMLAIDQPWEGSICTGSTFFHDGTYYAVYATRASGEPGEAATAKLPAFHQYFNVAVSDDGRLFRKTQPNPRNAPPPGFAPEDWRDPFGRYNPVTKSFDVLVTARDLKQGGCLARLVSKDMQHFEHAKPLIYTRDFPGTLEVPECSDWFSWKGREYLIYNGCCLVATNRYGPWRLTDNFRLDGAVMKTAPFTGDRRIGVAWISHVGWGFRAIFREAVQQDDGSLGWKFVPEMKPAAGAPLPLIADKRLAGRGSVSLGDLPKNYRLTATLVCGDPPAACGVRLRDAAAAPGLELRLDPAKERLQLGPHAKHVAALGKRTHRIEVYVKDEIVDVCIDDAQTVIVCENPRPGRAATLFGEGPGVEVRDIEVRPLREPAVAGP